MRQMGRRRFLELMMEGSGPWWSGGCGTRREDRHMRAASASCVDINGASGVVTSALSFFRLAVDMWRRTAVSGAEASNGWRDGVSSCGATSGGG